MNKSILVNSEKIKRIGVLTSGGDAPGMNAAIRAVIRTGLYYGLEVVGIRAGYEGLINKKFENLNISSAGNIIQRGGTVLQTARSERFRTVEGRQTAYDNIRGEGIDALIVIGGDGTFRGAVDFNKAYDYPIVGIPGTIDNDLYGTDFTIGYDTAINTVIEAVDKIRDTAAAHNRLFFVEVMGRDAGFIAIRSGIACGAEDILIPETKTHIDDLIARLDKGRRQNKTSGIIIVAEGDEAGGAIKIAEQVRKRFNYYETKVTILGHLQRGGSPTCMDRVLASELGYNAVKGLLEGHRGKMVGIIDKKVVFTPFENAIKHNVEINKEMLKMARILSS